MGLTAGVECAEDLSAELDVALVGGQLAAVFQPQISLDSGRIVAVEGLCRWQHPTLGFISPERFIPLAESTGAIHEIGRFMIEECIAAADHWGDLGSRIEMSVNISPLQLTTAFAEELSDRWRRRELPVHSLTLEITESLPVTDLEASVSRLTSLRDAGIGISLDDYGTGHASSDQLDRLPVTEVKLDRSLIQNRAALPAGEISDVVALAHRRELRVVAEGIENDEQLDFARDVGCDRAQGYLLGRPVPAEQIAELLTA